QRRIARRRRQAPPGGAHHGLEDEGGDPLRAEIQDFPLEFVRAPLRHLLRRDPLGRTIAVHGREQRNVDQRPLEGLTTLREAGAGKRAEGIAVPRALARYDLAASRLAPGALVLKRDLQAGFDRFGTAGDEHHPVEALPSSL